MRYKFLFAIVLALNSFVSQSNAGVRDDAAVIANKATESAVIRSRTVIRGGGARFHAGHVGVSFRGVHAGFAVGRGFGGFDRGFGFVRQRAFFVGHANAAFAFNHGFAVRQRAVFLPSYGVGYAAPVQAFGTFAAPVCDTCQTVSPPVETFAAPVPQVYAAPVYQAPVYQAPLFAPAYGGCGAVGFAPAFGYSPAFGLGLGYGYGVNRAFSFGVRSRAFGFGFHGY